MKHDACVWCSALVKVQDDASYKFVYCSNTCAQLDWMFRKWMNDKYLNLLIEEARNGKRPKDGSMPKV